MTDIPARFVVGALLTALVLVGGSTRAPVAVDATDITDAVVAADGSLDRTFSDMRFIEPAVGSATARMLVVDDGRPTPGAARMAILERDETWTERTALEVALRSADGGAVRPIWSLGRPWLLSIDATSVAVLADAPMEGAAYLTRVQVVPGPSGDRLVQGAAVRVPFLVDDAAIADVDGDGRPSIVLASSRTERGGGTCQGTTLLVLDPVSLATTAALELRDLRIAGGVVGRFDTVAGDDLFAYAYPNCPAGPDTAVEARALAVRLLDGSVAFDAPAAVEAGFLGSPMRLDAAVGDRHAVVARLAGGLTLLEPDGTATILADVSARPLAAVRADVGSGAALVAWMDRYVGGAAVTAATVAGGEVRRGALDGDGGPARWDLLTSAVEESARTGAPPVGVVADIVGSGCLTLFLPGSVVACDESTPRGGAAWLATRPLAIVVGSGVRRLVVAAGVGWDDHRLPALPSPAATDVPGWWRHGPSSPFTLAEIRAADSTYVRSLPPPTATIATSAGPGETVEVSGNTGSRLFLAVDDGSAAASDGPDGPTGSEGVLRAAALAGQLRTVTRVTTPSVTAAGPVSAVTQVSLPPVPPPGSWRVTVVPINDWGEVGLPAEALVTRDLQAPTLELEAPFLSAVWPVEATLAGTAEPRSSVAVDGGAPVTVGADGSFVVRAHLAPWPQTVRLVATDPSGNVSTLAVTLVGGIDYRQLPLQAMLAVGLIAAAVASGVFGSRRRRVVDSGVPATAPGPQWVDPAPGPEIEELPAGYADPAEEQAAPTRPPPG